MRVESATCANGSTTLTLTVAVALSLSLVVRQLLHVPIEGSIPLFMVGVVIYLFFAMSIGIFLATIARTMPSLFEIATSDARGPARLGRVCLTAASAP